MRNKLRSCVLFLIALVGIVPGARPASADIEVRPKIEDHYLFLFIVDGAAGRFIDQYLKKPANTPVPLLESIDLHFFRRAKGLSTTRAVTVWPASSLPGHVSVMTGAYPAKTQIGGQRGFLRYRPWHSKKESLSGLGRDFFYRSYIGPEFLYLNPIDLSANVKTIFEHFEGVTAENVSEQTDRGTLEGRSRFPHPTDSGSADWAVRAITDNFDLELGDPEKLKVPAHLFTINLPGLDHHAHRDIHDPVQLQAAAKSMDDAIGRVLSALASYPEIYEKSVFALTSDHGMGPSEEHVDLSLELERAGLKTYVQNTFKTHELARLESDPIIKTDPELAALASNAGGFYRVLPEQLFEIEAQFDSETGLSFVPESVYEQFQASVSFGGNSEGLISLQGTNGGKLSWTKPVTASLLSAYPTSTGAKVDLPARILTTQTRNSKGQLVKPVAQVFYPANEVGQFIVRSQTGQARIAVVNGNHCYRVLQGTDPLGYLQDFALAGVGATLPAAERANLVAALKAGGGCLAPRKWLELTAGGLYPDAIQRIVNAFGLQTQAGAGWHEGSPMSPDIGVNPLPGWDFLGRPLFEPGLTGSHGALDSTHSVVPLMIASPNAAIQKLLTTKKDGTPAAPLTSARTVDLVPTLLDLFGRKATGPELDGKSLLPGT